MTEKELNEKYIRDNIEGICQDCMYLNKIVPIINKMLSETYKDGLHQGWFDKQMDIVQVLSYIDEVLKAEDPPYLDVVLETIKEMLGGK